jgi:hypothetical protein
VRWTLLVPLGGHAAEIGARPDLGALLEAASPLLVIPAALLLGAAARRGRSRSPLPLLALGAVGMAWPRWGPLHMSGALGILVLLAVRALRAVRVGMLVSARRRAGGSTRLAWFAMGTACLVSHLAIAVLGAGPILSMYAGGPVRYWDDQQVTEAARRVARRVPPGGRFLSYFAAPDTIYPLTRTLPPGGLYVNTAFWFFLNKDDLDARVVRTLEASPRTLVFYADPPPGTDLEHARRTRLHGVLTRETETIETVDPGTSWRVLRSATSPTPR